MKLYKRYLMLLAWMAAISFSANAVSVENGVSHELAQYRAIHISDVHYSLAFDIPASLAQPVDFDATLAFVWNGDQDLQIDFQGTDDQLNKTLTVNGSELATVLLDEHIIIPSGCLHTGENCIRIGGHSCDKALNRHEDYLYSLFVPDHARSALP